MLTGQIGTQRKDVLRCVLVHRRVSRRTDQGQGIRRVTDHNHQKADQNGIQHLDVDIRAGEQNSRQTYRQDDRNDVTAPNERNT